MTERARFRFAVKEESDGRPFIVAEPLDSDLPSLGTGFISFDLPNGTSYEKAKEISDYLDDHLERMCFTK